MAGFGDFVLAWLPPAPARVLEVGCGREGGVVELLADAGYDIVGVDPDAPVGERFRRAPFQELAPSLGAFDATVAGRMLHHVDPLDAAVDLLAALAPRLIVDEFADSEAPQELAAAIACAIELPFELSPGLAITIGASIGIANASAGDTDIDAVLRLADTAMYDAKRNKQSGARLDHRVPKAEGIAVDVDLSPQGAG